jgi:protein-disulfide isomerase
VVTAHRRRDLRGFYVGLGAVVVIGGALLWYLAQRPRGAEATLAATTGVPASESRGYVLGSPDAPVEIIEFADFQCPACEQFASITEPDVRTRIVDAGLARYVFYDFPLSMHPNAWPASHAAACADDQGKFWEMHDRIFRGQPDWSPQRNPKGTFEAYAREVGVNVDQWEECYDSRKYQRRIAANVAEGERRNVRSTPTFIIGRRMVPGVMTFDQMRAYVDSARADAAASGAAAPRDSARAAGR